MPFENFISCSYSFLRRRLYNPCLRGLLFHQKTHLDLLVVATGSKAIRSITIHVVAAELLLKLPLGCEGNDLTVCSQ